MKNDKKYRLSPKQLSNDLPATWLKFRTTAELKTYRGVIAQERAMRAVDVGLKIPTRGFNIFVTGDAGSGKTSTLERLLRERAAGEEESQDVCYVYNFSHPDKPQPLLLPAGLGRQLARDMECVIEELTRLIPRTLSDASFGPIRGAILAKARTRADEMTRRVAEAAEGLHLHIEEDADEAIRVVPIVNGQPIDQETYDSLSPARRRRLEANLTAFQEHMDAYAAARRRLEREANARLAEAEVRVIRPLVESSLDEVARTYRKFKDGVGPFLAEVRGHILENHRTFLQAEGVEEGDGDEKPPPEHRIYQVNVAVDRTGQQGAPVVLERVPTPANLVGYVEQRVGQSGGGVDHLTIRAGALHQANGGYLLLQVDDLISQENAWETLKRSLRHKEVRVELEAGTGEAKPRIAGAMKPGNVPLQVKVVLVGGQEVYYALKLADEDFGRLFKIKAEFESSMPRTRANVTRLARFLGQVSREEGYLPIHRGGVAKLVEVASRTAEHQGRLTTHRASLLDLLAEADFFAREANARAIRKRDVDQALAEARRRESAVPDEVLREIREGSILIQTRGMAVGQINGIALYDLAGTSFGVPVRITARVYAGRRGVVNIDREVDLSGAIHDKGALILVGYLGGRFAQEQTLGLSASITFEQTYDEIDGDSASSAELYAMLSALSGCPIRQGVAVTGSTNQLGEVQPIGGVNEKVEGIYRVCKSRGLSGQDGVLIPASNVKNLMLHPEVIAAVRKGRFGIFAVETVDQGIELLTGIPAGRRRKDGSWTPGSINDRVATRITKLQAVVRRGAPPLLRENEP